MNNKDSLKDFCQSHSIRVIDTNKRAYKFNKLDVKYFNDPTDYNKIQEEFINHDTEPLYTIEIALSELQKIAEFEAQVFNHMRAKGHYDMFTMIMEQKEREKYFKNKYPAVQKAYEQYSLMLKMAESGEL